MFVLYAYVALTGAEV